MDLPDSLAGARGDRALAGASLFVSLFPDAVLVELSRLCPPGERGGSWKTVIERYRFPRKNVDEDPWVQVPVVLSWVTDQLDLNGWPNLAP